MAIIGEPCRNFDPCWGCDRDMDGEKVDPRECAICGLSERDHVLYERGIAHAVRKATAKSADRADPYYKLGYQHGQLKAIVMTALRTEVSKWTFRIRTAWQDIFSS